MTKIASMASMPLLFDRWGLTAATLFLFAPIQNFNAMPMIVAHKMDQKVPETQHFEPTMPGRAKSVLVVNRRRFGALFASAVTTLGIGVPSDSVAEDGVATEDWQAHVRAIIGTKMPVEDRVTLDLPERVENGNVVPFQVAVDYPMTDTDFIKAIHIIATANLAPPIASFYFTALSGAARAASRMRLLQTQDIVALAQTSGGEFFTGRRRVEVVVGCCGE